jgi:hypothetical protein
MRLLTDLRTTIQRTLEREVQSGRRRDVYILAVDGIPCHLAYAQWRRADVQPMRTVFPSTSSSAWLSSVTGRSVDSHAVPGVVFRHPDTSDLINVYTFSGPGLVPGVNENIFSDGIERGYRSVSILGDLEECPCAWRDALLQHSEQLHGHRFYTAGAGPVSAELVCRDVKRALLRSRRDGTPTLAWCFVEVDRHIHVQGYDQHVRDVLTGIDEVAHGLAQGGAVVVAYSDHGLVPTKSCRVLEEVLMATLTEYRAALGGAGRTRWVYAARDTLPALEAALRARLPASVRIEHADLHFPQGSAARRRVGDLMLIATGEEFITSEDYTFDHGSLTELELCVPWATWGAEV